MRNNTCDYREVFLSNASLLDVRAPIEFDKGAFPGAINLPLMNDIERQKVGTCYKQSGQAAALSLGHRLVSGQTKQERIAAWAVFARAHSAGYLYCFRGGLRSQIVQEWLQNEAGIAYPRVTGGYKSMRNFLLETTARASAECDFIVLGGMTGTGKTDVLEQLTHSIDLEAHAYHRGSSFGKHVTGQPVQINFENALSIDILKKRAAGHECFVLEDESGAIGRCSLPIEMYQKMQLCPMVWLEDSLENRIQRILRDYVFKLRAEFVDVHGEEQGFIFFAERLRQSLGKIEKRLGGERHQRLAVMMDGALSEQWRTGDVELHRGWIEELLAHYYDPMYIHQRKLKSSRIVFVGDQQAVIDYLTRSSHPVSTHLTSHFS